MTENIINVATGVETGVFDNTTLDAFRNCNQYYDWRINKKLTKPGAWCRMTSITTLRRCEP